MSSGALPRPLNSKNVEKEWEKVALAWNYDRAAWERYTNLPKKLRKTNG